MAREPEKCTYVSCNGFAPKHRHEIPFLDSSPKMAPKQTESRTHCIRCGTCCLKGGPALHREDADLFKKGILKRHHVFTLRKGEAVRDFEDTLVELAEEMVKIKGQGDDWTCTFYSQKTSGCTIYAYRPLECRALRCWDLRELKGVLKRPHLKRCDLLQDQGGIMKLIAAHDERCRYDTLKTAVEGLTGDNPEQAVERVIDLVQYDDFMRPFLTEKLGLDPSSMDFLFGRPFSITIRMHGLQVKRQGEDRVLVPVKERK